MNLSGVFPNVPKGDGLESPRENNDILSGYIVRLL